MKKLFASLFVAFAMIAMVSCSNPAIDAAKDFIDNPTKENYEKAEKAEEELDEDEKKEYEEWYKENKEAINKAIKNMKN